MRYNLEDFERWLSLEPSLLTQQIAAISDLEIDDAAALLRIVGRISNELLSSTEPTVSFVIAGSSHPEELLLAALLAKTLEVKSALSVFPSLQTATSLFLGLSEVSAACKTLADAPNDIFHLHQIFDLYGQPTLQAKLLQAINLSGTSETIWRALEILLQTRIGLGQNCGIIDIKIGAIEDAFTYEDGMDLGRMVLKIATLTDIKCCIYLSDAQTTESLAFGLDATLESISYALQGGITPFGSISINMVREALFLLNKGTDISPDFGVSNLDISKIHQDIQDSDQEILNHLPFQDIEIDIPSVGYVAQIRQKYLSTLITDLNGGKGDVSKTSRTAISVRLLSLIGDKIENPRIGCRIFGNFAQDNLKQIKAGVELTYHLSVEKPMLVAPVRVVMSQDSILIRRQTVVLLPVKRSSMGSKTVFFIHDEKGGIGAMKVPYDLISGDITIGQLAEQLLYSTFNKEQVIDISLIRTVLSDIVQYDASTGGIIKPYFFIYRVLLRDDAIAGISGYWIEENDISIIIPTQTELLWILENIDNIMLGSESDGNPDLF
ncbi:MAG: hypothetical protein H0V70_18095 [Ktedonobacteraceae bacterium]|nr:hypothetical protein [Ktedonobacteraceae bacterium]